MKGQYFWPEMDKTIKTSCSEAKINRHTMTLIPLINIPSDRFHTVNIDNVGPLPPV